MPTPIFEDRFDGPTGTWGTSAGTPTIGGVVPPSGGRSLRCDAIGDYVYWDTPNSGYTRIVLGAWVWWEALPAASVTRTMKVDAGPCEGWLRMQSSGEPGIIGDGTPGIGAVYLGSTLAARTWYWNQVMFDVSADPWEIRANVNGTVISSTAAAAASNLDPGIILLGNTVGGEAIPVHFGHMKAGVAAADDDWFDAPKPATSRLSFNPFPKPALARSRT